MSEPRIDIHPEHQHRSPGELAAEEARALGCLHVPTHPPTRSARKLVAAPKAREAPPPPMVPHGPHPTHCER